MKVQKNIKGEKKTKVLKLIKFILFTTMLISSYFVSDKVVDYLITIDTTVLKRALNLILVVTLMLILMYTKEKGED